MTVSRPLVRFNLSILECKSLLMPHTASLTAVLIYPYWNVNAFRHGVGVPADAVLIYPYWNVNCMLTVIVKDGDNVLIYPYWNVNCLLSLITSQTERVLIYPYWNVNIKGTEQQVNHYGSFNLSILECKSHKNLAADWAHQVLIYPYWNVNSDIRSAIQNTPGFNLSILECKYEGIHKS